MRKLLIHAPHNNDKTTPKKQTNYIHTNFLSAFDRLAYGYAMTGSLELGTADSETLSVTHYAAVRREQVQEHHGGAGLFHRLLFGAPPAGFAHRFA